MARAPPFPRVSAVLYARTNDTREGTTTMQISSSRWFIIRLPESGIPAFVVAECVDEAWACDSLRIVDAQVVLSEDELKLDPDLAPVLAAWEQRDDRGYADFRSIEEAEFAIGAASFRVSVEEDEEHGHHEPAAEEREEARRQRDQEREDRCEELVRYYTALGEHPGLDYFVEVEAFQRLSLVEKEHGVDRAVEVAKDFARQLASYASRITGVKTL